MQLPASIMSTAETNALAPREFVEWCAETGMSALDASNALALQIAKDYIDGRLDYDFCDRVMNSLLNAVTTEDFFAVSDRSVPEQLMSVYLAFDAGEYVHPEDRPEDNQEAKYTRPMIQSLLARASEA